MSNLQFTESVVEDAALAWLEALGYGVLHGLEIVTGEPAAEHTDPNFRNVILERRPRQALAHLNPGLPSEALEDAYRKLTRTEAPSLRGSATAPTTGCWWTASRWSTAVRTAPLPGRKPG